MTPNELAQHEAIKALFKQAVENNPNLTPTQKTIAKNNIDTAGQQADWIMEMLRMCGCLRQKILFELDLFGIKEANLFPEVDKMAGYLKSICGRQ